MTEDVPLRAYIFRPVLDSSRFLKHPWLVIERASIILIVRLGIRSIASYK